MTAEEDRIYWSLQVPECKTTHIVWNKNSPKNLMGFTLASIRTLDVSSTAEFMVEEMDAEQVASLKATGDYPAARTAGIALSEMRTIQIASEKFAWAYAVNSQGYTGTFAEWLAMDADERAEYEAGAAGLPTA